MASEACDREQMYLDVLGSRDLMSKKPFTRQTECKTPQTHEPDYNIGLAETTTLMRVPLPLCPTAPRPFPTTPCATHAALDTQSSTRLRLLRSDDAHTARSHKHSYQISLSLPQSLYQKGSTVSSHNRRHSHRASSRTNSALSLLRPHSKLTRRRRVYCVSRGPPYRHGDAVASSASPYAAASQRSRV